MTRTEALQRRTGTAYLRMEQSSRAIPQLDGVASAAVFYLVETPSLRLEDRFSYQKESGAELTENESS